MNHIRFPALVLFFLAATIFLLACASSVPQAAPPTTVPTLGAPTTAPTTAPTLASTTAAANTPSATSNADADEVVADALKKYRAQTAFHLQAHTEVSPVFFAAQYTPLPGDDPDLVTLFTIDGEQNAADLHYALKGFLASFIGVFSGFDPDSNELEILNVDGKQYMRGKLDGETESRWYLIPDDPSSSSSFSPQEMLSPMTDAAYPTGSFSKSGTATIGSQTCDVFTGSRAAFDAVFPTLVSAALLNEETLDLEGIDQAEYTITICPDGNVYRIVYNFDAHAKNDASKKGTFTFETELADFDGDISIVPPSDAIPMPSTASAQPTSEPVTTPIVAAPGNFTTLNGEWEGTSGDDSPLSFTVEDGVVTYINLNYALNDGGCSVSGVQADAVDDGAIQDSKFSVALQDSDGVAYTLAGEFESNNQAAGTFTIQGKTFCGETDKTFDWTAQHISSPDAEATPESAIAPTQAATAGPTRTATTQSTRTPTRQPTTVPATSTPAPPTAAPAAAVDGVKIITDAFAAFAARDLNAALANVSDNVAFNIGGTAGVGKAALQSNMQLALTFGAGFTISNVQQVGDAVTFTTTVTGIRPGTYTNSSVVFQDGKIVVFNIN